MSDKAIKVLSPELCLDLISDLVIDKGGQFIYEQICSVNSEGQKVGPNCYNWDRVNNCPSCLVGQVMFAWGIPAKWLSEWHATSAYDLISRINAEPSLDFEVTRGAAKILGEVQMHQDVSKPWGTALAHGVKVYLEHLAEVNEADED